MIVKDVERVNSDAHGEDVRFICNRLAEECVGWAGNDVLSYLHVAE